MQALEIA